MAFLQTLHYTIFTLVFFIQFLTTGTRSLVLDVWDFSKSETDQVNHCDKVKKSHLPNKLLHNVSVIVGLLALIYLAFCQR